MDENVILRKNKGRVHIRKHRKSGLSYRSEMIWLRRFFAFLGGFSSHRIVWPHCDGIFYDKKRIYRIQQIKGKTNRQNRRYLGKKVQQVEQEEKQQQLRTREPRNQKKSINQGACMLMKEKILNINTSHLRYRQAASRFNNNFQQRNLMTDEDRKILITLGKDLYPLVKNKKLLNFTTSAFIT